MKAGWKPGDNVRRDWIVILVILLVGLLCVILAGEWAIRFAPFWKLDASMGSSIDPDSDFLTNRPAGYFEPLDPAILTQPAWINVFLTPGASFPTRTPVPLTNTSLPTNTPPAPPSSTPTQILPSPTPTQPFLPPPTSTARLNTPRPPTSTPAAAIPVDLRITKTDGSATYTAGSSVTYSVIVANNGPNSVTGAAVSDPKPAQVTTWGWCAAPCTPSANTSGDLVASVNLASGASATYTILANLNPAATGNLVNTASVSVPSGYTDTAPANNSATDTDSPAPSADLQISKTDNSTHYLPNATKTYVIVVTNVGPSSVSGATVTDVLSTNSNLAGASWTCSGSGGATCTSGPVSGDISDTVNIPAGSSVTYTVIASVSGTPSGNLVNTASVSSPIDANTANNSATDTDILITTDPTPTNISSRDNIYYTLASGSTLTLPITLAADGNPDPAEWDLIFYEFSLVAVPPPDTFDGIWLDWIVIQISDGNNWYTVLNWGDNLRDTNTNVDFAILTLPVPPPNPEEMDQRPIASADLYGSAPASGIAINVDGIVPPGTYSFIRFYAPVGDTDGGAEIDAFEILP